jgi:hypothetical protein
VNYSSVVQFEAELDEWFKRIPVPTQSESNQPETQRTQLLLLLAYAHVQMVLYRPFILHVIRTAPLEPPEMRSFACASACIKAAMQIVWIVEGLESRDLLISAYWFTIYITFFAVMALCMFVISNPNDPTVDDVLSAAQKGRKILIKLATESVPADKCVASLGTLFDKISLLCFKQIQSDWPKMSPTQFTTQPALSSLPAFAMGIQASPQHTPHTNFSNDSGIDIPSQPSHPLSGPEIPQVPPPHNFTNGFPSENQQHHHHHQQRGLLAMMYPPLDAFHAHPQQPPLPSPMYGHVVSPTDNEYFPCFNAGWEDGILPSREMGN